MTSEAGGMVRVSFTRNNLACGSSQNNAVPRKKGGGECKGSSDVSLELNVPVQVVACDNKLSDVTIMQVFGESKAKIF